MMNGIEFVRLVFGLLLCAIVIYVLLVWPKTKYVHKYAFVIILISSMLTWWSPNVDSFIQAIVALGTIFMAGASYISIMQDNDRDKRRNVPLVVLDFKDSLGTDSNESDVLDALGFRFFPKHLGPKGEIPATIKVSGTLRNISETSAINVRLSIIKEGKFVVRDRPVCAGIGPHDILDVSFVLSEASLDKDVQFPYGKAYEAVKGFSLGSLFEPNDKDVYAFSAILSYENTFRVVSKSEYRMVADTNNSAYERFVRMEYIPPEVMPHETKAQTRSAR